MIRFGRDFLFERLFPQWTHPIAHTFFSAGELEFQISQGDQHAVYFRQTLSLNSLDFSKTWYPIPGFDLYPIFGSNCPGVCPNGA